MKNIHVLPTPKPSRIYLIKSNNKLGITSNNPEFTENFGSGTQNQHIYITSNKEIKDNFRGWFIGQCGFHKKCIDTKIIDNELYLLDYLGNTDRLIWCKKIILTTDQDLIKDGVQPIDDTFLEWFIKNSSCEFVKIDLVPINEFGSEITVGSYGFDKFKYKIIIPQEEPKQEPLEEIASKLFGSLKTGIGAERRVIWMNGVKWQQEQDKNKFSEEEVMQILINYLHYLTTNDDRTAEEWFEQFKKK
jgi:hypothetical protein